MKNLLAAAIGITLGCVLAYITIQIVY